MVQNVFLAVLYITQNANFVENTHITSHSIVRRRMRRSYSIFLHKHIIEWCIIYAGMIVILLVRGVNFKTATKREIEK